MDQFTVLFGFAAPNPVILKPKSRLIVGVGELCQVAGPLFSLD